MLLLNSKVFSEKKRHYCSKEESRYRVRVKGWGKGGDWKETMEEMVEEMMEEMMRRIDRRWVTEKMWEGVRGGGDGWRRWESGRWKVCGRRGDGESDGLGGVENDLTTPSIASSPPPRPWPSLYALNTPYAYPLPSNNSLFFRENSIRTEKAHRLNIFLKFY